MKQEWFYSAENEIRIFYWSNPLLLVAGHSSQRRIITKKFSDNKFLRDLHRRLNILNQKHIPSMDSYCYNSEELKKVGVLGTLPNICFDRFDNSLWHLFHYKKIKARIK